MQTEFSLERIARLVSDLEQELAGAPAGSPKLDALRAEIEVLKRTLASPDGARPQLTEQLHGVRGRLDDVVASVEGEALRDTPYLIEIGRILGLV
jgi:hypothetical protein